MMVVMIYCYYFILRVESNSCQIDKLSKTLQSVDDRCSKLEEYTLQILDVVGHLQLSIPGSMVECEGMSLNNNDHEVSMGLHNERPWNDRYIIQNDRAAPVLDRMISMPAYMHQKVPPTGSSPLYFRNKLPLTNPYQYREQFNSGANAPNTSIKRAISRFRTNTLPRVLPDLREKRQRSQCSDDEDEESVSSSINLQHRVKRADSVGTTESFEGRGLKQ